MLATPDISSLCCGDFCRKPAGGSSGTKCGLCPLARSYSAVAQDMPAVWEVAASDIPQPQRDLLAHNGDMTTKLEVFHGDHSHLLLLRSTTDGDIYQREVVLVLNSSGQHVEFGAITIHLDRLPPLLRRDIIQAELPFGTLLHLHRFAVRSRPTSFICVEPDAVISRALALEQPGQLYGRCNALLTPSGEVLADIVEILPL